MERGDATKIGGRLVELGGIQTRIGRGDRNGMRLAERKVLAL